MSDTPEKIYVGRWDTSWHDNRDLTCDIEYIRADLVDGMRKALEAGVKALMMCGLYLEDNIPDEYQKVIDLGYYRLSQLEIAFHSQAALEEMKDE